MQGVPHGLKSLLIALPFLCAAAMCQAEAEAPRVATVFALSGSELQAMTLSLPREIRNAILAAPHDFLQDIASVLDEPALLFLLVDKNHPLAPDFKPADLVSLKKYTLSVMWGDVQLRKAVMPALMELASAAKKDGVSLVFSSGYRSFEYQKYVYAREVKTYGQETADRESARPGASQHQLGTAVDFGSITDDFGETRAGRWLAVHAEEHGFSLSYPQGFEAITGYRHESWHFRYITKSGTLLQKKYFGDIQQYMLEFLDANREMLEARRVKNR